VIGLVIAGPVLLVLAVFVRLTMGSPVFFRQPRLGQFGSTFDIVKLRSMRPPDEGEDQFLTDADRVTGLGRFLRRTSLDELPELLLVVSGTMSLVGPRPLLPVYQELMDDRQRLRLIARPGLTGLAQISGRQDLRLSERLELDVRYVETWSFSRDLAILLQTLVSVFRATGVKTGQTLSDIDDIGLQARLAKEPGRDVSEGEAG
jgi:sugar transferase EpsL